MFGILAKSKGSLYRSLALPFSVFVLFASLALAGYISYWSQQDALRQLENMAVTNAKFIEELNLPRSKALSERLSTILGVWVGFYISGGDNPQFTESPWPADFKTTLEAALEQGPTSLHASGQDIAIAPFDGGTKHLILARETRSLMATGLGDAVLVPTILLTLACGGLAYYLARRIVIPLTTLTNWLPQLEHDDRPASLIPKEISERGDELGTLARSLEETHRRLLDEQRRRQQSERMATLGRIATSLAHEIRNPASSIGLHADLLARDPKFPESESIHLIRAEVDRITDLVNQWLFVVRPAPPQSGRHDFVALVVKIAENLRTAMDHASASLHIEKPDEPLLVNCDHARIEQVVRNLLVNAVQAMPEGGEIRVQFERTADKAILSIQDSGAGFSQDALQHFGEAFFSEREGGMGIGLTLACEVIAAHGGSITGTNASSGGAIVQVQLPLT